MAMACSTVFTFFPERPLTSVPRLCFSTARSTDFRAASHRDFAYAAPRAFWYFPPAIAWSARVTFFPVRLLSVPRLRFRIARSTDF